MALQVEVVSPEAITYSGEAELVVCRTVDGGDIAFQPGHVPLIGVLQVWEAKVIRADGSDTFAVHSGFVQVAGEKVTILSDISEPSDNIDVERARAAQERAQQALAIDADDAAAAAALRRAQVRISVATGTAGATH